MPTIPQEISQSTKTLTDNATIVEQFAQGAANTFIPVRGGTLRPLLYWQGTFQNKVTELAQPYVDHLVQANQVADSKVQAASDSAAAANQSAQEAAASAASVDFPTRLAELNAQQTRLARSLAAIGDHGQSMHMDFLRQAFALGNLEGLNRTLSFTELFPDFTRESPKWVFDATGTLVEVGIDEPAFDHDPLTGEPLGPLIERGATNLLSSSTLHSSVRGVELVGAAPISAPDGSSDAKAYRVTDLGVLPFLRYGSPISGDDGIGKASSIFVRAPAGASVSVKIESDDRGIKTFSLNGAEWLRIATDSVGMSKPFSGFFDLEFRGSDGWQVGDEIYVWGAQLEEGSKPTSYIPTTNGPVTRAPDNLGRLLGDEYRQDEGTIVFSYSPPALSQGDTPFIYSINDGTHNNSMSLVFSNSTLTSVSYADMRADGFPAVYFGTGSTAFGPFEKNAIRYSRDGSLALAKKGDLYKATGEPLSTLGLNNLILGGRVQSTANNLNGHLRYLLYIPRAVSDAKLQELIT
jgi:hypothetical protein